MKKLEIEKTKPTFIISVLKVDILKVGLVFSISNVFIAKKSLANKWRRKKIPSCSNSALEANPFHQNTECPPEIFKPSPRLCLSLLNNQVRIICEYNEWQFIN